MANFSIAVRELSVSSERGDGNELAKSIYRIRKNENTIMFLMDRRCGGESYDENDSHDFA
jgi:hypothetical protein